MWTITDCNPFTMHLLRVQKKRITDDDQWEYITTGSGYGLTWRGDEHLYPSREALIDAQIKYWKGLKEND